MSSEPTPTASLMQELRDLVAEAARRGDVDPDAACLSTVSAEGVPSGRVVFVSLRDDDGPIVFTMLSSGKARQLAAVPHACLTWYWPRLEVQAIVDAEVQRLDDSAADEHWRHRPRDSQIGAWAALPQGTSIGHAALRDRASAVRREFSLDGVPRPDDWCAWQMQMTAVTIWPSGWHRLQERRRWIPDPAGGWQRVNLNP